MVHVQEMDEADIGAVSMIRVRGWQAAYGGIVPQTYLDAMTAEGDAGQRRQWFSQPGRKSRDLVALGDCGLVGWICFGPYRGEMPGLERVGEVYALYISPDLIGQGIGRTLLGEAHAQMTRASRRQLCGCCVTTNEPGASTSGPTTRLTVRLRTMSTTGSRSLSSATSACFSGGRSVGSRSPRPGGLLSSGPCWIPSCWNGSPRDARNWTNSKNNWTNSCRKCGPNGTNSRSPNGSLNG
ncbi:GNAT family N-acetyltransferase [Streptomyces sp. NPDC056121]|uniref:GNAT family N-acetyltransferase n=1 Tax=Streptomyces sp. NPDC056121 TaxID=3345718 RepID=UPI0035D57091